MKKILFLTTLISFLSIIILYNSCKKYENDEAFIHLRSVKNRVTNKWKFEAAMGSNFDVTDSVNMAYPNLWFDYKFNKTYYSYAHTDSLLSFGTWEISNYGKELGRYPNSGGVVVNTITRLDKDQMWLKAWVQDRNDSIEYRFVSIK